MGQNNITVKHLRQQRFLLSRNSCGNMLVYMCVLCEVLLHPPQVSRLRRGCHIYQGEVFKTCLTELALRKPKGKHTQRL